MTTIVVTVDRLAFITAVGALMSQIAELKFDGVRVKELAETAIEEATRESARATLARGLERIAEKEAQLTALQEALDHATEIPA